MLSLDHAWRVAYVSRHAESLLGRRREELIGRNLWHVFPEAAGSAFGAECRRSLEERLPIAFHAFCPPLSTQVCVRVFPVASGLSLRLQPLLPLTYPLCLSRSAQAVAAKSLDLDDRSGCRCATGGGDFIPEIQTALWDGTHGRLFLCHDEDDLPIPAAERGFDRALALEPRALRTLRRCIRKIGDEMEWEPARRDALAAAASEIGMNAIVHGGGGLAEVRRDLTTGAIQVWIRDRGRGIDLGILDRAVLEAGFSTVGTLGLGFCLAIESCDRMFLCTSSRGTTVVLETEG